MDKENGISRYGAYFKEVPLSEALTTRSLDPIAVAGWTLLLIFVNILIKEIIITLIIVKYKNRSLGGQSSKLNMIKINFDTMFTRSRQKLRTIRLNVYLPKNSIHTNIIIVCVYVDFVKYNYLYLIIYSLQWNIY